MGNGYTRRVASHLVDVHEPHSQVLWRRIRDYIEDIVCGAMPSSVSFELRVAVQNKYAVQFRATKQPLRRAVLRTNLAHTPGQGRQDLLLLSAGG